MKGFAYLVFGGVVLMMLLFWCNRHEFEQKAQDFQAYQHKDLLDGMK